MAAATLFGPVVAGTLVERYGWGVTTAAMGAFAFSGAIPSVSCLEFANLRAGQEMIANRCAVLLYGGLGI